MSEDKDSDCLVAILKNMDWNFEAKNEDVSKYRKMIKILDNREDWLGKIVRDALKTEVK